MIAKPARWHDGTLRPLVGVKDSDVVLVEVTITQPASQVGRTAYVHLDPDDVTELLLELRSVARHTRRVR